MSRGVDGQGGHPADVGAAPAAPVQDPGDLEIQGLRGAMEAMTHRLNLLQQQQEQAQQYFQAAQQAQAAQAWQQAQQPPVMIDINQAQELLRTAAVERNFKFQPPKHFTGKDEEFEVCSTKFKSFMGSYGRKYVRYMEAIQDSLNDPVDLDAWQIEDPESTTLAAQLQYALLNALEGPPLRLIMHYSRSGIQKQGGENGFEAWRQLCLRNDKSQRVRTSSTLLSILTWEFKAKDFEPSFIE